MCQALSVNKLLWRIEKSTRRQGNWDDDKLFEKSKFFFCQLIMPVLM